MPSKRYRVERIIAKLREAEKLHGQGLTIPRDLQAIGNFRPDRRRLAVFLLAMIRRLGY